MQIIYRTQRVVLGEHQSGWVNIESGVPQGSVIGPTLFLIYVNDLLDGISCQGELYADDCKIFQALKDSTSHRKIQDDLDKIIEWTRTWKLYLNSDKCKVMHFGNGNTQNKYHLNCPFSGPPTQLNISNLERDLGILISDDLKWSCQVNIAASKANRTLGMILNTFHYMDSDLLKTLYCAYVRPLLEFASPAWNPYLRKDIDLLEKVQKRATKVPTTTKDLPYETRLSVLGLQSLEERRTRYDVIQQYRIVNGMDIVDWYYKPVTAPSLNIEGPAGGIRGNDRRLEKEITQNLTRLNFFTNRVVSPWNGLDNRTVNSPNLNIFKSRCDRSAQTPCVSVR